MIRATITPSHGKPQQSPRDPRLCCGEVPSSLIFPDIFSKQGANQVFQFQVHLLYDRCRDFKTGKRPCPSIRTRAQFKAIRIPSRSARFGTCHVPLTCRASAAGSTCTYRASTTTFETLLAFFWCALHVCTHRTHAPLCGTLRGARICTMVWHLITQSSNGPEVNGKVWRVD